MLDRAKRDLFGIEEKVNLKRKDRFYEPIDDSRKKELIELVLRKRKLYSEQELQKIEYEKLEEHFKGKYNEFYQN